MGKYELNKNLAQMLKGGVIMDVTNAEQAKIAKTGEDVIYRSRFRGGFLGQSPMLGFHLL